MASNLRKSKLESLLQGAIANFLIEHQNNFNISSIVLVDDVMVAPDLKSAQVWLGFSPSNVESDIANFKVIRKHVKNIHNYLFKKMPVRKLPRLELKLSNSENAFKMESFFDTLKSHDRDKNQTNTEGLKKDSTDGAS